jgi:hypothetical protein
MQNNLHNGKFQEAPNRILVRIGTPIKKGRISPALNCVRFAAVGIAIDIATGNTLLDFNIRECLSLYSIG